MHHGQLEEYDYTLMYEKTSHAADTLSKKIQPVLDYYNDNYLRFDSKVKFFYFNKSNLAVKFSPSITKDMLNTDLRHFLNVINEKFATNPRLEEFKITTTKYWLVGIKSLSRLLIIMLPVSLAQDKVEEEKIRIVDRYFAQFIF